MTHSTALLWGIKGWGEPAGLRGCQATWRVGTLSVSGPQHRSQKRPGGVKTGGGEGAGEKPTWGIGTGSPPPGVSSELH